MQLSWTCQAIVKLSLRWVLPSSLRNRSSCLLTCQLLLLCFLFLPRMSTFGCWTSRNDYLCRPFRACFLLLQVLLLHCRHSYWIYFLTLLLNCCFGIFNSKNAFMVPDYFVFVFVFFIVYCSLFYCCNFFLNFSEDSN